MKRQKNPCSGTDGCSVQTGKAAQAEGMGRRTFLSLSASSALYLSMGQGTVFGKGVLSPEELYARLVPRDKGLAPDWIASLTTRGHPLDEAIAYEVKDGVDPEVIGMTVGGIGCGTVYLSGDGQLWIWDIFNMHHEGVVANSTTSAPEGLGNIQGRALRERDGANFLAPPRASDHKNGVDAHFRLTHDGHDFPMDASGWEKVSFTGRWPMGIIDYSSSNTPLTVRLEACSPFIPLSLKDSSLPLTVLEYTVGNPTAGEQEITLTGHLNNPVGQFSNQEDERITETFTGAGTTGLHHGLRASSMEKQAVAAQPDVGSMALAVLNEADARTEPGSNSVAVNLTIPAKSTKTIRFVIAWYFPNLAEEIRPGKQRHYVKDFTNARDVVAHYSRHQERLMRLTRDWVATWNDSTLPQWFLDRTLLPANTLQTQNCLIFEDGRFWANEGIGCCAGTCGHVWQYAQGHARLFPELERNLREVTDYGLAQKADGSIPFRGTNGDKVAIDSQASYVLRTLRDHQLSDDPGYLKRVWAPARKAIRYLIEFDAADERGGLDGLLDGEQHNTLDAEWYGKVHVLCSMYLASLRAAEELAVAMDDAALATEARSIYEMGRKNIAKLYNGEFYEQIEDPDHLDAIGVGKGCYIDQVMGQYWANQVGLGRLYDADHQKSALRAIWKYNFVPEYGSFRRGFKKGRHYASAGDSGLLMCTWPLGGLRDDFKNHWQYAYFNEFMTGFEYQAAAHMVAERDDDLVRNGLAITRAIHDRYSATRGRNPYNEIECSDHYARAGSAYAVFLALCGFAFDQSTGRLAFDPVIPGDRFKVPFTTSEAWGSYEQKDGEARLLITHGQLTLNQLELGLFKGRSVSATLNGDPVTIGALKLKKGDVLILTSQL